MSAKNFSDLLKIF